MITEYHEHSMKRQAAHEQETREILREFWDSGGFQARARAVAREAGLDLAKSDS